MPNHYGGSNNAPPVGRTSTMGNKGGMKAGRVMTARPKMAGLVNPRSVSRRRVATKRHSAPTTLKGHTWNNGRRATTGPGFLRGGASKRLHYPSKMVDNGKRTRVVMSSGTRGNHAVMQKWNPGR